MPTPEAALDAIDREIIMALKRDGRTPFAHIAQALGVSTGMIRNRYHRLVRSGVLQVVAVTNPLLMGYKTMALIGVKAEGQRLQEIADQIGRFDEVVYLVLSTGRYDLLVEVVCRDNAHLLQFLTGSLHHVEGVRDTETLIYLRIMKEVYHWAEGDTGGGFAGPAGDSSQSATSGPDGSRR